MRSATRKKTGKDPEYLAWLHTLGCLLCKQYGIFQILATEAAHTGLRGMSQKGPDREAIPLCCGHHRLSPDSYHRLGKRFYWVHNLDREAIIKDLNSWYERSKA